MLLHGCEFEKEMRMITHRHEQNAQTSRTVQPTLADQNLGPTAPQEKTGVEWAAIVGSSLLVVCNTCYLLG